MTFNPLNAKLSPICHLLALLAHHILHVSRIRVNTSQIFYNIRSSEFFKAHGNIKSEKLKSNRHCAHHQRISGNRTQRLTAFIFINRRRRIVIFALQPHFLQALQFNYPVNRKLGETYLAAKQTISRHLRKSKKTSSAVRPVNYSLD